MLPIVQAPKAVLAQKAKAVAKIDKSIHNFLKQMVVSLKSATDPEGVGLAAPQVDKSLQIFIARQTPRSPILTFINPKIESFFDDPEKPKSPTTKLAQHSPTSAKKERERGVQLEGCLSHSTKENLKDLWQP